MGRIFNGIFLGVHLFVMFLFHFFLEHSKNIPLKMEQKHNKQLHRQEYSIEYSAPVQQLTYEVISGIFL